jgi:lipopolysaccharide biosynthesis regulator YciM
VRVVLILAVLLPLAAIAGWLISRPILAAQQRRRHIEELEAENRRLDELLNRDTDDEAR